MTDLNIPDEIGFEVHDGKIRFSVLGISTGWLGESDSFTQRLERDNLNPVCIEKHAAHEIKIKNILDKAIGLFGDEKYPKAIECLDEVLFYDPDYLQALICKSYCLKGQGHFVKSLRYYKRAAKCGYSDVEYHRDLLKLANGERENFPKIKLNIYAGDEHFSKGEYEKAVESYDRALSNPSKFKEKILYKLLNKKGFALLKLERFGEALECFRKSLDVRENDYAYYGEGYSEYELGQDLNENFKKALRIDKKHLLDQALILNEVGLYGEALGICDVLFENHFAVDELYFRMLSVRLYSMQELGMDLSGVEEIFEKLG